MPLSARLLPIPAPLPPPIDPKMLRAGTRAGGANSTFTADATNVGANKAVKEADYQGQLEGDISVKVATPTDAKATATGTDGLANGVFTYGANGTVGNFTVKFVSVDGSNAAAWDAENNTMTISLSKDSGSSGTYDASALQSAIQALTPTGDGAPALSGFTVTGSISLDASAGSDADLGSVTLAGGSSAGTTVTVKIGDKEATKTFATGEWQASADNEVSFSDGNANSLSLTINGTKATNDLKDFTKIGTAKAPESKPTDNDKDEAEKIASGTKIEIDMSAAKESGKNFEDGDTIKIGDQVYKFVTGSSGAWDEKAAKADIPVTLGANFDDSMKNLVAEVEKNKDTTGISAAYANGKLTLTTTKDFASADELKKAANVTVTGDSVLKDTVEKAWNEATSGSKSGNGSIILQIGDTSDSFNQLTVTIGNMHTNAMGTKGGDSIADIKISSLKDAQKAISVIKDAINYVSSVRGDLGTVQNRLEHTVNNLSVMTENITDAESTIRDTDVAEEMMAYTKNNILIQSAQAMLAQANAVPQGVLQLLG